jgi:hypothetical protein
MQRPGGSTSSGRLLYNAAMLNWFRRLRFWSKPKTTTQPREASVPARVVDRILNAFGDPRAIEALEWQDYRQRCHELEEARAMRGTGPWLSYEGRAEISKNPTTKLREDSNPMISQGAYGDIELALSNVEWRREINLSWLEFSRWGIQQIILISRLYYMKNPIVRRLIDIDAAYVFGRGVEVSSPDENANEVLQQFFADNKSVMGQNALADLERRKFYDGNLFWCFFPDTVNKGSVKVRNIDAVEIMDVITNPDDIDEPWFYRRSWTQRNFTIANGQVVTESMNAYYPALGYQPEGEKPLKIQGFDVMWDNPIYHRKCGAVAKWHFGCPIIYPCLDWARSAKRFLEACATIKAALAQFAMTITTKGGQQAIMGIKQELQTLVGPPNSLWDQNPTPNNASTFVSGPGTQVEPFMTRGAGADPEEVRQYKLMCCMVVGVPETFLADVSTGNLATATTLDRPTELVFIERQEAWREDLVAIAKYVLSVSAGAPGGKIREAAGAAKIRIVEMERRLDAQGCWRYVEAKSSLARRPKPNTIEVRCDFPAIREGDIPQLVTATVASMTLGNTQGQVVGIDERAGVMKLLELLGFENPEEILDAMYPEKEYEPDRTIEDEPEPPAPTPPFGGIPPQQPNTEKAVMERLASTLVSAGYGKTKERRFK